MTPDQFFAVVTAYVEFRPTADDVAAVQTQLDVCVQAHASFPDTARAQYASALERHTRNAQAEEAARPKNEVYRQRRNQEVAEFRSLLSRWVPPREWVKRHDELLAAYPFLPESQPLSPFPDFDAWCATQSEQQTAAVAYWKDLLEESQRAHTRAVAREAELRASIAALFGDAP